MQGNRTHVSPLGSRRRRARRRADPAPPPTPRQESTEWWEDLDASILAALADGGKSPRELGEALGISEASVTSLLYNPTAESRRPSRQNLTRLGSQSERAGT
jgi:hypothetical protein